MNAPQGMPLSVAVALGLPGQLVVQVAHVVVQPDQAIVGIGLVAHHGLGGLEDHRVLGQDAPLEVEGNVIERPIDRHSTSMRQPWPT